MPTTVNIYPAVDVATARSLFAIARGRLLGGMLPTAFVDRDPQTRQTTAKFLACQRLRGVTMNISRTTETTNQTAKRLVHYHT